MTQRIFFGRHGCYNGVDTAGITEEGVRKLGKLNIRLRRTEDFRPMVGVASTEQRTMETARILLNGKDPIGMPILHAYGNNQENGICVPGSSPTFYGAREYAAMAYLAILNAIGDEDAVVITHDETSTILACWVLELNGRTIDWSLDGIYERFGTQFPNHGEGVLVSGDEYELFLAQ